LVQDSFMAVSASRRTVLGAALGGAAAAFVGTGGAHAAPSHGGSHGGPPTVTENDLTFTPGTTLRAGSPQRVGLAPDLIADMVPDAAQYLVTTPDNPDHPMYAGATVIAVKDGQIVQHAAVGKAVRYGVDGTTIVDLPADQQIDATTDTIWDLASMSKLFTATAVMQLIERGAVDLEAPVVTYLPDFASAGKSDILIRHCLTHTSGLIPDPDPSLWEGYDTYDERVAAIQATVPDAPPDTEYVYSDLNFMTLGLVVQAVSGQPLDEYVNEHIIQPLGLKDTMYNPPASLLPRIAAQEYEPWADRGMVWGSVHDENAWALNGVAGHAGVFSTSHDMAVFAQTYLNGGRYGSARILSEDTVRMMLHDYTVDQFPDDPHGLGWELALNWYMGAIGSPETFGHTGFTGTTIVVDPLAHQFVIFLSNRVHPSRDWSPSNNVARRAMVDDMGLATAVKPAVGGTAWFSRTDDADNTLTVPLAATGDASLSFDFWYDTEANYDTVTLATSPDGSTFTTLPFHLHGGPWDWQTTGTVTGYGGRRWLSGSADLPTGTTVVRWTYATDTNSEGRGVYLDAITVRDGHGVVFDSERSSDAARISVVGWQPASR
jgi:CubicO group peptidase (beta-lactamase class C family)